MDDEQKRAWIDRAIAIANERAAQIAARPINSRAEAYQLVEGLYRRDLAEIGVHGSDLDVLVGDVMKQIREIVALVDAARQAGGSA